MREPSGDTTFTFTDPDGFEIFVRRWVPAQGLAPKAVVQIVHGAAEHSLRYERFAKFLNAAGYVVYANDHRGHGRTAGSLDRAGWAGEDGWNGMVKDVYQLTEIIKEENPGLPVFMFAHSMGSLIAQQYIQQWGGGLRGVVLCGSSGARPNLAEQLAAAEAEPRDKPSPSWGLRRPSSSQSSGGGQTGYEWLTRDQAEVQKYADDPWCGFAFTSGLVVDLLRGRLATWKPENEARIPKTLPIFVISGDKDPAGGKNGENVKLLVDRYAALGLADLAFKLYPDARHELLNEINRDEVHRDLLQWFDSHLSGVRPVQSGR